MSKSEFTLVASRYLLRDGKLRFFIQDAAYAGHILEKAQEEERTSGADSAMKVLSYVQENDLRTIMRDANAMDSIMMQKFLKDQPLERGSKFRCTECPNKTFYDLNEPNKTCPQCGRHKNACTKIC